MVVEIEPTALVVVLVHLVEMALLLLVMVVQVVVVELNPLVELLQHQLVLHHPPLVLH